MIAYIVTNKGRALNINISFKEGKTYCLKTEFKTRSFGFYFFQSILEADWVCPFRNKDTEIYEIEVLGDITKDGFQTTTDKIKIVKKLSKKEIQEISENKIKYDENGNLIEFQDSYGNNFKYTYDKNNRLSRIEKPFDFFEEYENDDNGNLLEFRDSHGTWEKYEYDDNNNIISFEDESKNKFTLTIE